VKKSVFASVIIVVAAIAAGLMLRNESTHADLLPLDECAVVGNATPTSRLCVHEFSDHTKCVVSVTRGTETPNATTTALSCKIT
jgi:hypothetical protein